MAMKIALRLLKSSIAATLAAMLLLGLTIPITIYAATGTVTGEGFWPTVGAMIVMLPFVAVIGGMIALPLAIISGGAMLWWENKRGVPFTNRAWIIAGMVAGLLVSAFVGTNDDNLSRLIHTPWFIAASILGAWVFARTWRRSALLK
jgi:hypothetical protein